MHSEHRFHRLDRSAGSRRLRLLLFIFVLTFLSVTHVTAQEQRHASESSRTVNTEKLTAAELEFFESRIRPILVANCYECHNSSDVAEGGLAVDWRGGMAQGGEQGSLLEKRDGSSLLLSVVRHELPGLEMPEGAPRLSQQEIEDLEKWLNLEAPDPRTKPPQDQAADPNALWTAQLQRRKQWWSFRPIAAPSPPQVQQEAWPQDPLDNFILRKIEDAGEKPSPHAEARKLIRRAYYATIGLPPTAEQVEQFVALCRDTSDQAAYAKLVDQLLESEHFGEKWARHWMDWVRYADSHGSEGDPEIVGAHQYRDYLIRALNNDVPYDQLLREHVAGDLVPAPRINETLGINESLIGTAHWRFVFHGFAPTDPLDERVRFTDDAINVVSKAFMGLTVSCARCHHHKFDAISQDDYYAMFGIVSSARPGRAAIETPDKLLANSEQIDVLKKGVKAGVIDHWRTTSLADLTERLEASAAANTPGTIAAFWSQFKGTAPPHESSETTGPADGDTHKLSEWFSYGAGLAGNAEHAARPVLDAQAVAVGSFIVADERDKVIEAINPAGYFSNLRSSKLPARLTSSDFMIKPGQSLHLLVRGGGEASLRYVVQDYPRDGTVFPVRKLNKPNHAKWHWQRFDLDYWKGDAAHVELAHAADGPLLARQGGRSHFGLRTAVLVPADSAPPKLGSEELNYLQSRNDYTQCDSRDALPQVLLSAILDSLAAWQQGTLTDDQAIFLDACLLEQLLENRASRLPQLANIVAQYRELENQIPEANRIPTLAEHIGRNHPLYERGDHRAPAHEVPRRFLEAIDATPYESQLSGRLELAEDMLRPDNPFTARVIANRLWHHLLGRGLVATPDNFGRLGEPPTHPELLDYLASELRNKHNWHLKALIRRIVLSATFQQSAIAGDESPQKVDPKNQLWSRALVRRLDAEAIRDSVLAASGQLDTTLYGEPANSDSTRRSVYLRAKRNEMDAFLTTFNSPVPFSTQGRREATNVPAQSLLLMNSVLVTKQAGKLVDRVRNAGQTHEETVATIWRAVLHRDASVAELESAVMFVDAQRDDYIASARQRAELEASIAKRQAELQQLRFAAISRWRAEVGDIAEGAPPIPDPMWSFAAKAESSNLTQGSAKIKDGDLVLDGRGWLQSPLLNVELHAKTLVASLKLDGLNQQGGGVVTVQTPEGEVFDAIVYGEQEARKWLAGSNFFARTQSFVGPPEVSTSDSEWLHVALVTQPTDTPVLADTPEPVGSQSRVTFYRNGKVYGQSYTTSSIRFEPGNWQVLLGMRHGTAAGSNRMLKGQIREAAVYDSALGPEQIAALYSRQKTPAPGALIEHLSQAERERYDQLQAELEVLDRNRVRLLAAPEESEAERRAWQDLAHALFNTKEFLYVQ